jgi:hypothetical protein
MPGIHAKTMTQTDFISLRETARISRKRPLTSFKSLYKFHRTTYLAKKIQTKRLRFATTASAYNSTLHKQDCEDLFYHQEHYRSFNRERRDTLSAVKRVYGDMSSLDSTQYCLTGMEQLLSKSKMLERKMQIKRCKQTVLEQQHYQRFSGVSDAETLRAVSSIFSEQAATDAHLRATSDCSLMR